MNKKTYYRLSLVAMSAFSIGGSFSRETDSDVIVDSLGNPLIPASSLAGVLRHALGDKEKAADIFGELDKNQSAIKVYDACMIEKSAVSVRDNVALKEDDKVAAEGAKFDRQVVDQGARFVGYLEIDGEVPELDAEAEIEQLLARLHAGQITLGSKTSRGMGVFELEGGKFQKKAFGPDDVDSWLDFDMFDDGCWSSDDACDVETVAAKGVTFELKLEVRGALSIRQYTTELPDVLKGEDSAPDFKQLALGEKPLIPGTSWAGAFRSQYRKLTGKKDSEITDLFGSVSGAAVKSKISFTESIVEGGEWKLITRNSIDRYTGGTIDAALFTELTHFGGETTLRVAVKDPKAEWLPALIASFADLHNGFMAVGGLTAVGHGLFGIAGASMAVDGKDVESFARAFAAKGVIVPDIAAIMDEVKPLLNGGE